MSTTDPYKHPAATAPPPSSFPPPQPAAASSAARSKTPAEALPVTQSQPGGIGAALRWFILYLLLCSIAFTTTLPFVWMVFGSLKPRHEVEETHFVPKDHWEFDNYAILLRMKPDKSTGKLLNISFGKWYYNSVFIACAVTFLQLLTSAMAAYAFSRIQWPGRDKLFFLYLATMMIPGVVLMIPNFQIMVTLGWVNTYTGLVVPAAFTAFGTFLLRQFMLTIPPSLDEAARIDGASHWQCFWDVILPLARPGLVTLGIFALLGNYQSFFWPLVMVKDDSLYTLPIGMMALDTVYGYGRQTELILAATVMNILPLLVIFIIAQKALVRGIQLGAVKG